MITFCFATNCLKIRKDKPHILLTQWKICEDRNKLGQTVALRHVTDSDLGMGTAPTNKCLLDRSERERVELHSEHVDEDRNENCFD